MDNCLDDEELVDEFDENSYMMNGIYGGETMDDKFMSMFEGKEMNVRQRDKKFLELMKMMEPLFLGLTKMHDNKFIHNDIKSINIVFHNGVFKYIDFGLAGMLTNKDHFKERSLDELRSNRIYMYYPLEYLLYYATKNELNEELQQIDTGNVRYNYDILSIIYMVFGRDIKDIYNITVSQIKNKKINQTKMIKGIDTYSLGILIPLLFLRSEVSYLLKEESELINDFYNLFGQMITPLPDYRISPQNAYKQFKKLLKKYKNGFKKRKKSIRKRTIQRRGIRQGSKNHLT